jgi:NAD(P)H-binding
VAILQQWYRLHAQLESKGCVRALSTGTQPGTLIANALICAGTASSISAAPDLGGSHNVKVILFGATGMVGQGVLRECLLDPDVESVLAIGRSTTGQQHEKLHEIVHKDLLELSAIADSLAGYDACFFCLGVSSAGMTEQAYRRVTYDLTMSVAGTLAKLNPAMTFIYVSGAGTDSTERGRTMWARVKGKTENALLQMPFKAVYAFRPAYIQPLHGIRTKTKWYGAIYAMIGPLYPVWKLLFPKYVTTTECVGRAMLKVAKQGAPKRVLESQDIGSICRDGS